jgi:hypothetical protein
MNNRTVTGSITGAAQSVTIDVSDQDEIAIQVTGTFTATIVPEGSVDGTNFVAFAVIPLDSVTPGTPVVTTSAPGIWYARNVTSLLAFRMRCSAFTSGTAVVSEIAGRVGRA